jgi:hypothetical protein
MDLRDDQLTRVREVWWDDVAVASAVLGLVVLIPYRVAAHRGGEATPWGDVFVHALCAAGVLVLLLVPSLHGWVNGPVMAGRDDPAI